jgi:ligand-binding SRPBCC domain-containing protein
LTQIVTIIVTPQIFSCYARMTWHHEIERSTRVSQKIINKPFAAKHQHNFKF